jgi:hypothetical protein
VRPHLNPISIIRVFAPKGNGNDLIANALRDIGEIDRDLAE